MDNARQGLKTLAGFYMDAVHFLMTIFADFLLIGAETWQALSSISTLLAVIVALYPIWRDRPRVSVQAGYFPDLEDKEDPIEWINAVPALHIWITNEGSTAINLQCIFWQVGKGQRRTIYALRDAPIAGQILNHGDIARFEVTDADIRKAASAIARKVFAAKNGSHWYLRHKRVGIRTSINYFSTQLPKKAEKIFQESLEMALEELRKNFLTQRS